MPTARKLSIAWAIVAGSALIGAVTHRLTTPAPAAPYVSPALPDLTAQIAAAKHAASERSSKWPTLRKHHLLKEPCCQWCGRTTNLQVHHIRPFHLHPEVELDPDNLITLCETPGVDCHLRHGHDGNFHNGYNLNIRAECEAHRKATTEGAEDAEKN